MSHLGHLEGEQPYLGDLLTMVINHLLTGMILQVDIQTPGEEVFGPNNHTPNIPQTPFTSVGIWSRAGWTSIFKPPRTSNISNKNTPLGIKKLPPNKSPQNPKN